MAGLRTVFFGTPDYAVPTLKLLVANDQFDVALVVTQPDRPAGRGRRLAPPPVKVAGNELGIEVYQPSSLRAPAAREPIEVKRADLFLVAAFGLIFGKALLALPRLGCLNLHASLLPAYRGASPVTAAILNGDHMTGVSLMRMDSGLDTGPVIATAAQNITSDETTASLTTKLAVLASELAVVAIPRFAMSEILPKDQPRAGASLTRPLIKADGWLDWTQPAEELERHIRATWSWPRAWTTMGTDLLQVHKGQCVAAGYSDQPGRVRDDRGALIVGCGAGALVLEQVQMAGGKPTSGEALLSGRHLRRGDRLGQRGAPGISVPLITPLHTNSAD